MLTKEQKKALLEHMQSLKPLETKEFSNYSKEEAEYIHFAICHQKGRQFECNGTEKIPSSITKFRKLPELITEKIVNKI